MRVPSVISTFRNDKFFSSKNGKNHMIYFKNQHRKSQNSPWACTKLCLRKSPQIKMFKAPQKKLDCSIYLSTFSWEALNRFTRCGQDIWTIFWHRKMLKWQAIVLLQSTVSAKSRWKLFSCSFYACTMSMKCTAIRTFFSYAATPPSLPSLFFSEVHS